MGIYQKLRTRLDQAGVRPSTRRGQNFLLDGNQLGFIADAARLSPRDVVLEVGPGSGFLTRKLALSGALVFAVELDFGLLPVAEEETRGLPNVFFMQGDILAGKNKLNQEAMDKTLEMMAMKREMLVNDTSLKAKEPVLKCVSNLPYSAGTPFIINILASSLPWSIGVFLLQKEVAERLVASPGGKDYGTISIFSGLAAKTEILRIVPPRAFWPKPNVDSAVIRMEFTSQTARGALPWPELKRVTSAIFGSRRKILKNALKGIVDLDTGAASEYGDDAPPIDFESRGETLLPVQVLRLATMLKEQGTAK